jgi:glycosyltransferase involved in cell wall biosynthesis
MQITEAAQAGIAQHIGDLLDGLDPGRYSQMAVLSLRRADERWIAGLRWPVERVDMRRSITPPHDWAAYQRLLQVMRDARPALVHTHSSKAGILGRRAAYRLGIPALHTPHVFSFQMSTSPARRRLYVRLERAAARWCRYLICVSEAERGAALAAGICSPEKLAVIRNGVDVQRYADLPGRAYRAQLGVAAEAELVLAVGGLRAQKDYPTLLRAVAAVSRSRPRLRCLIAGEGPDQAALRQQIEALALREVVTLLGEREDVPALLSAADLFVMTSLYEGCSYSLLEAMAAGTPVVARRAPGVEETVAPGTGWLVAAEDLPSAISEALDHPQEAAGRAARAHEMVAGRFRLEDMLAQTAALYEACLSA